MCSMSAQDVVWMAVKRRYGMNHAGISSRLVAVIAFGIAILVCSQSALAQVTTGSVLGTVKDQSGAVLPGATVTATNTETGISRSGVSSSRGEYRLPSLGLGNYEVQATMAGFQSEV